MLKKIKKYIKNNSLLNIATLNSFLVLARFVYGFVASKVVAIYLGPQGLALIGNFRDFSQIVYNFSAKNFESGIIKNISENVADAQKKVITIFKTISIFVIIISFFLFFGASFLSELLFKSNKYEWVFKVFCFSLPFISSNLAILSILNGKRKHRLLVEIQIIGFVCNSILLTVLIMWYGFEGALVAFVLFLTIQLMVTLYFTREYIKPYLKSFVKIRFDKGLLRQLMSYFLMALFSISLTFVVNFLIRNKLINTLGMHYGGYWEAINRISSFYLMFFTSMLTFYLLPKLAMVNKVGQYRVVMKEYFKLIIPLLFVLLCMVYVFRSIMIKVLLSDDFLSIRDILQWQLIGDFFRIFAVSFAYQFHAKRNMRAYYVSDTVFYLTYLLLSFFFIFQYEVEGVLYAYLISNILFLVTVLMFLKKELFNKDSDVVIKSK